MKRAVIAGVVVAILGGLALWAWMPALHDGVVLAKTARATTVSTAASAGQGGAWAQLAEATRQADAGAGQGQRFCGAPFMDDAAEPTGEMNQRLKRHIDAAVATVAKRLAQAPDELGRMTSAVLARDEGRIAEVAAQTRDPVVYGLGAQVCEMLRTEAEMVATLQARRQGAADDVRVVPPPSPCSGVTFRKWVELDPGNASAWWALASTTASNEEAIRAVRAGNAAPRVVSLRGQLLKRIASDGLVDPAAMAPVLARVWPIDMGQIDAVAMGVTQACGHRSADNAEQQSICEELLIGAMRRQSSVSLRATFAEWAVENHGVAPARLPERLEDLRKLERDIEAWRAMGARSIHAMSCARAQRAMAFEIAMVAEGEEQAYRRLSGAAGPQEKR